MSDLLPPNATPLEKAIALTIARLSDIAIDINTLWDSARCPVELLPWLAWSLSVDTWNSNWPEDIKRRVIADSFHLHGLKGTVQAIKTALSSLGVDADIIEQKVQFTATVMAWVRRNLNTDGQSLLSPELTQDLLQRIEHSKRASVHITLELGLKMYGALSVSGAASVETSTYQSTESQWRPRTEADANLALTGAVQSESFSHVSTAGHYRDTEITGHLFMNFVHQDETTTFISTTGVWR